MVSVRIHRAQSDAAMAKKIPEGDRKGKGWYTTETATGSGFLDAFVVHEEKQKAYEVRYSVDSVSKLV